MESLNTLCNDLNNNSKENFENEKIVIPSNFLISNKEIIARFPHNKRVGNYLLGRKLGEGSFAKVKEGLHTLTGQKVAIKVIDKKKAKEDPYVSKNMRREGKLLQMIIHPNIVQLFELMETENSYYLVAELCEGGDLMDYICSRKFLSEVCTRKFIRQIISAVDYLHRIGILHRDLKIENLLLDRNYNIKLIDFGLSNYTKNELCITQCGSPAYAAPELLAHKKYGPKVDVWSIGVNMYAMLTGNLPFTVEPFNIKSLYNKMMKNEMNPIPEHLSKIGEDLLRKLLNSDPYKRISLKEAMDHDWVNEGYKTLLKPFPYPNKPTEEQLNPTILRYMTNNMQFNTNEITENIKLNKASSALATYYLLLNKIKTMIGKMEPKKEKVKSRIEIKNKDKPKEDKSSKAISLNIASPIPKSSKTNETVTVSVLNTISTPVHKSSHKADVTIPKLERGVSPAQCSVENSFRSSNDTGISNCNSSIAGAIKNLAQKYKTMHINTISKDNKVQSLNNNQIINFNEGNNSNLVYNTIYQKNLKTDTNVQKIHNGKNNTSIVYNSDLITSINKSNQEQELTSVITNGNLDTSILNKNMEFADFINTNVNKVASSSSNLNESNNTINYQHKIHSSSPVLYPLPSTIAVSSPSPMVGTSISSTLSNTYLSPLFTNNKTNKSLINKNNSCLHVPRLIKSPILQRVSSITLPSINLDTNDHSINSSAK